MLAAQTVDSATLVSNWTFINLVNYLSYSIKQLFILPPAQETIHSLAQKLIEDPLTTSSIVPPRIVIRHIAKYHINSFINIIINRIGGHECDDKFYEKTSCINTSNVCLAIFVGAKRAYKIYRRMTKKFPIEFTLESDGAPFTFTVQSLFDGIVINKINNDENYDTYSKETKKKQQASLLFQATEDFDKSLVDRYRKTFTMNENVNFRHTEKIVKMYVEFLLQSNKFNFNSKLINTVKQEMKDRIEQTTLEKSFIYAFLINSGISKEQEHAWVIEQCHYNTFNLYQSWIGKGTLYNDMKSREPMDYPKMEVFLSELENCFSPVLPHEYRYRYMDCLGYSDTGTPLTKYREGTLTGLNLRVHSFEVNPRDALNNFYELSKGDCYCRKV